MRVDVEMEVWKIKTEDETLKIRENEITMRLFQVKQNYSITTTYVPNSNTSSTTFF